MDDVDIDHRFIDLKQHHQYYVINKVEISVSAFLADAADFSAPFFVKKESETKVLATFVPDSIFLLIVRVL